MRPLTKEVFNAKRNAKNKVPYGHITVLPDIFNQMAYHRATQAAKVILWLKKYAEVKGYYSNDKKAITDRIMECTRFKVDICHDNDYIEVGVAPEDPEKRNFHIKLPFTVELATPTIGFARLDQELSLFAERKLPINAKVPCVYLDWYDHNKHIEYEDYNQNFELEVTFKVKYVQDMEIEAHELTVPAGVIL